jgi:succinate dehydrogenase/fumarate reductase flavoprotein subunit
MNLGRLTPTMYGPTGPLQQVPWSADNSAEVDKGWIIKADTLGELAAACGMDAGVLASTVGTYNSYCEAGVDPDFGRPAGTLVPLSEPPYYAVQLWPGGPNTQGGPRRNAAAQVMSVRGESIPRLYSAGEFGSIYGMLYPSGGGNIAECLAFGRIAGRNVAAEKAS